MIWAIVIVALVLALVPLPDIPKRILTGVLIVLCLLLDVLGIALPFSTGRGLRCP